MPRQRTRVGTSFGQTAEEVEFDGRSQGRSTLIGIQRVEYDGGRKLVFRLGLS